MFELPLTVHLRLFPLPFVNMAMPPFELALPFKVVFLETPSVNRAVLEDSKSLTMLPVSVPSPFILSHHSVCIPLAIENIQTVAMPHHFVIFHCLFI